ncbi:MAG: hypothetical protein AB2L09_02850 [Coriobacteriia bacterium]
MSDTEQTDDVLLGLQDKSNEELHELLDKLYAKEQRVSYKRRILHGQIDILRAELVRRLKADREGGAPAITGSDIDGLIAILSNDLRGVSRFDVTAPFDSEFDDDEDGEDSDRNDGQD